MNEITTERNPVVIAAEINSIKDQARAMILSSSIEIGRRLVEAKEMLQHGEWGKWLEKSVDYSHDTATNLMKIYKEYGNSNFESIRNLSYTKAVALLGIPQNEREQFAQENDLLNITVRKLQEAIKEKEDLGGKLQQAQEEAKKQKELAENIEQSLDDSNDSYKELQQILFKQQDQANEEIATLKKQTDEYKKQLSEAHASGNQDEIERLGESLAKTDNELIIAHEKIKELERLLKETPVEVTAAPVIIKIPEEIEKELAQLRKQNSKPIKRFTYCFDSLVNGFRDLLGALAEITDLEAQVTYKVAVKGLIGKMSERL
ncbi:MAG: DUF3102 domain-containing protein [Desulfitobacteriaceae bacterium]